MKTLTLRLNDETADHLQKLMKIESINVASKAIVYSVCQHEILLNQIDVLNDDVARLTGMINGLSSASDTFKAVLNHLDQQRLNL